MTLCSYQQENYQYLSRELAKVAESHGERVLITKNNPISIGICSKAK